MPFLTGASGAIIKERESVIYPPFQLGSAASDQREIRKQLLTVVVDWKEKGVVSAVLEVAAVEWDQPYAW